MMSAFANSTIQSLAVMPPPRLFLLLRTPAKFRRRTKAADVKFSMHSSDAVPCAMSIVSNSCVDTDESG
jgi:hypothetical protein